MLQHVEDGFKPEVLDAALAVAVDGHPQVLENNTLGQGGQSNIPPLQSVFCGDFEG